MHERWVMIDRNIIYCIIIAICLHIAIWFQLNGQLVWKWFRDNTLLMCLCGMPISYGWLKFTQMGYEGFGEVWPIRLLGFATGMISFPILTWFLMGEGLTIKSIISILLSIIIVILQLI